MRYWNTLLERMKKAEGFRSVPVLCPLGGAVIGYGHRLERHPGTVRVWSEALAVDVEKGNLGGAELVRRLESIGMIWNQSQAQAALETEVLEIVDELSARCPAWRHLTNLASAALAGRSEGRPSDTAVPAKRKKILDAKMFQGRTHTASCAHTRAGVLVEMAFCLGVNALLRFQTLMDCLLRDDYDGAASSIMASRWAGQVGRRSTALARIMRTGEETRQERVSQSSFHSAFWGRQAA